jgi:ATP-dependent helicase/DNAse subunit B
MPITLISGPANAGKAQLVMDGVRGSLARGEEPLLVVPTRVDAEHYLRELAGEGVALGVRVERFEGLIEQAVRRAGPSESVLGFFAREHVLSVLATGSARPPSRGMVRALSELIAELRVRRVSPASFARALEAWSEIDGQEVSRGELAGVYERYQRALQRLGRMDSEQRAIRALDALRRKPSLWGRTPVAFYGFDDLTRLQLDVIETLGRVVDAPVTVSLAFEPGRSAFAGRAATFAALAPLAHEHRELVARADYYAPRARAALGHLERSLFEPDAARVQAGPVVRLLEGGGERAELELVAHEINGLRAEGMAAEEIAVATRGPAASDALLEEVFAGAGVPFALERRRAFADTALGRALSGLLRCLPSARDAAEGEVGDLLAWLRAPGLLVRPELADALELRARRSGARTALQARSLWEQRHWRLETIDQLQEAAERGPGALIDRVTRELQWLFDAPRRRRASVLCEDELEDAGALAAARRALAELRELARLAPELAPQSAAELAHALERVEVLSGERFRPGAVAVLDPLALRARRVRALFLCGLQEGQFPARARTQPLLAEEERRRLVELSDLCLGEQEDALASERYLLYAAVSRPEELLVLSWHVADDEGEPTARSLFVDDICDLFDETLSEERSRRPLGAVELSGAAAPMLEIPRGSSVLREPSVLRELRERPWSASSLEQWIGCPMRWFVERLLHPGRFDPQPEPFARGGLAHAALSDTLEGLRAETGSARIAPARLARARALLRAALEANEERYPLSVAPERRPSVRRRLRADLEHYLDYAAELDSRLEPRFLELGFGIGAEDERGEASELGAFELGPGVRMRGRIDRVDVNESGEAVLYDYKSSADPSQAVARWIGDGKIQLALYMLAVEQLLDLRVVGGFYQPLSGAKPRARGVLDEDSAVELDCVRGETRPHEEVRALLGDALDAALRAASQAGRGELEARPQSCAFRGGCEFPAICRCEA